jgi:hypothetical protein
MADLLDTNMFKVYSDILRSDSLRIQHGKSAKFGYLPMMAVTALGALNAESFCEHVLSCVKLVVSDLHESENRGDSYVCHAPDESRVYAVHEDELPGHSIVGLQNS